MTNKKGYIFFAGMIALLMCGCFSSEYSVATHTQDVFFYSTEKEVAMGRNIARRIAEEFIISNSPYDIKRLQAITSRVVEVIDRQELSYYFYIVLEDEKGKDHINAFSIPGGYVYIFKELMDLLDDDELAFVVAHEIGHIVSRHHIKRLQAAMGYNLLVIASSQAPADPQFSRGVSLALAQILTAYSREDEFNADELAVKYCKLAGYDPNAGIRVQEKLYAANKEELRPLSYFKTHPYTAQRIRKIKERLHLPLGVEDYINF